jgi:hypothetical protein
MDANRGNVHAAAFFFSQESEERQIYWRILAREKNVQRRTVYLHANLRNLMLSHTLYLCI